MRSSFVLGCLALLVVSPIAGCGNGDGEPARCIEDICPCSEGGIRAAIDAGGGPYLFDCDGPATVVTGDEIVIDNDVILDGQSNLTIDGNEGHRVLRIDSGVTATLVGMTIANGRTDENGAGIRNDGTLTMEDSTVSGNVAGDGTECRTDDLAQLCSEGGGIWSSGTLTLTRCIVSGNSAPFGGGLSNREGSMFLVGTVRCSGGGGVWNSGVLTMDDTRVSENAADWGGGVFNRGAPMVTNSIVSRNSSGFDGGGLLNFETLTLTATTVSENNAGQSGGGIANEAGTLELVSSTLSDNTAVASGGAIISQAGAISFVLNATLSSNAADTGGAIYTGGEISLRSSTVVFNEAPTASAIFDPGSPSDGLRSIATTLVEGECAGTSLISGGHNIEGPADTCGFSRETDQPNQAELGLGPLENNGGPTATHALLESSVAIDRIPEADCVDEVGAPLAVDQRGESRPGGESPACDIGAFEAQP